MVFWGLRTSRGGSWGNQFLKSVQSEDINSGLADSLFRNQAPGFQGLSASDEPVKLMVELNLYLDLTCVYCPREGYER